MFYCLSFQLYRGVNKADADISAEKERDWQKIFAYFVILAEAAEEFLGCFFLSGDETIVTA